MDRHRVFISHCSAETELAKRIAKRLHALGIETSDLRDAGDGQSISSKLKKRVQNSDALIAMVTSESIHSEWLAYETGVASGLDRNIVPVLVDVEPDQLPSTLHRYARLKLENLSELREMMDRSVAKSE